MKKTLGVAALSATLCAVAVGFTFAAPGLQDDSGNEVTAQLWQARLTTPDLAARESYFDELVDELRVDSTLRATVERWSSGTDELAWTARLALRAAPKSAQSPFAPSPFAPSPDPFDPTTLFGQFGHTDLDDMLDRMQALQQGMLGGGGPFQLLPPSVPGNPLGTPSVPRLLAPDALGGFAPGSGSSQSSSFSLQQGPDGVRVEITEGEHGNSETKTYEAATLEELLEEHPELRDRVQPGLGGALGFGATPLGGGLFGGSGGADLDFFPPRGSSATLRTDRLGILVRPLTPEAPEHGHAAGLVVERVNPGSLGQVLGLRQGDVLLELNGAEIHAVEDVAEVLRERASAAVGTSQAKLRARVVDKAGVERDVEWNPEEAPSPRGSRRLLPGPGRRI